MFRRFVPILVLCATACSDQEPARILEGERGACGSVVRKADPDEVECPSSCPTAVKAFRVLNTDSCERSNVRYVACVATTETGRPGAAILDTADGPVFIDDPTFGCVGGDGCTTVDPGTTDRWKSCESTEDEGCACACSGGECAFNQFAQGVAECGLSNPCAPLAENNTEEELQCYLDILAQGGPIMFEATVTARDHLSDQETTAQTVFAVANQKVVRVDEVAYSSPIKVCDLQPSTLFFNCDPRSPDKITVENLDGAAVRISCLDPNAWTVNCTPTEPICPG